MKYLLVILFSIIGFTAFSQTGKLEAKKPCDKCWPGLTDKQIDSLINRAPDDDSLFISMKHLNEVLVKIRKEWNMENGEPATQALQLVLNAAFADLKKRRAEYYKPKN
jgi:hypothetical protein